MANRRLILEPLYVPLDDTGDHRRRVQQAAKERASQRTNELDLQASPMKVPHERIGIWEQLHALRLPGASEHALVRVIARQTGLTVGQVREEQKRRARTHSQTRDALVADEQQAEAAPANQQDRPAPAETPSESSRRDARDCASERTLNQLAAPDHALLLGKRILIVENEDCLYQALRDSLQDAGCEVIGSCDRVKYPLDGLSTNRLDAALVDMDPLGSGRSTSLAQQLGNSGIPTVWITSRCASDVAAALQTQGWLRKPFTERELLDSIACAVNKNL